MAIKTVLKNFNLFVDGRGNAGQVEEFNPPKLTMKKEEFRGGGMDAPVDLTMGMEKMECDFSVISHEKDILTLFDVREGINVPLTMRGALEDNDGTVTSIVYAMRGKVTEIDRGTISPGEKTTTKVMMTLNYFKETHNGDVIREVDVEGMKHIINGVDALADKRAAIGL